MTKIKEIKSREIIDSRGNPTVETKVILENGITATAGVPSGASTGVHEAHELRDKDKTRYRGKGVLKAVENVEKEIFPKLQGMDVTKQIEIDNLMIKLDGTKNKKKLGANAILSVSLACARAAAHAQKKGLYAYLAETYGFNTKEYKFPIPSFNIFNGGAHADTNLDFQEFMIMPIAEPKNRYNSFAEMVRMGAEIFHELGVVLREKGISTNVGNEGGYASNINSSIEVIEYIMAASMRAGYNPGVDMGIGIDVGSSELYDAKNHKYIFKLDNANFTNNTLIGLYNEWLRKYPIISIEDGLAEDDWEGWQEMTRELGKKMMIIGDDLYVTNILRLKKGLEKKAANSILIKPNQVGSLTETINCIKLAQKNDHKIMVSHRSGETNDDFIADLAVATGAGFIKTGAPSRGERLAKYNRLMEIEKEMK